MKSCLHCGLPAPAEASRCAMCRRPYRVAPERFRLEGGGPTWTWVAGGAARAVARRGPDGAWTVRETASGASRLGLVPIAGTTSAIGLVDADERIVGVVTTRGLRDASGRRAYAVRDSDEGIHVVGRDGTVVAVGSRVAGGLELLVTGADVTVFAVVLAGELVRSATAA